MCEYLANQIILGKLEYIIVITKKPELKNGIDEFLIEKNRKDLIVNIW